MIIIKTKRNIVYTDDPQPDAIFVQVVLQGPVDEHRFRFIELPHWHIDRYADAVAWAAGIADMMAKPLRVQTWNYDDIRNSPRRFLPYLKFLVGLAESNDAQERDEALRLMRELGVMP
ncbi:hypothetical protein L6Q21_10270 [Sandaracinobacter sp. RS1-74]|uniref:hypothetical protein n=1 Tax=Sandaracinobacteroides sayramensis TaxID=2913411 RepID=UPI001EDAB420|nr:hypothetical protein [Sandaracinobacteroides sayramensis]MCG2841365.1 hypothetical protein [Sandaracinobacteroides sayramensis]